MLDTNNPWLKLVESSILRPARPRLDLLLHELEQHLESRRRVTETRNAALAKCTARIEAARADVFAANDGVVTGRMTTLEREWRMLARRDPDEGLMDLWARIVPSHWIDSKRWRGRRRDSSAADAAIALASDVAGVEAAETAAHALGFRRVYWTIATTDSDCMSALLEEHRNAALAALAAPAKSEWSSQAKARAEAVSENVLANAIVRFPERPNLARSLAQAVLVDALWTANRWNQSDSIDAHNPTTPLYALWLTGYVVSSIDVDVDGDAITLECPAIQRLIA